MKFVQYYLDCLSQASYLIGDETTGRAVVVDPRRDVDEYVADAEAAGLRIEWVIETHFHADFLSGHLELAERTGATIGFGPGAETEFVSHALADGERIELGDVVLEVRHTPGHTPESISVVVWEHADDAEPWAVLTGDTLFIGDVGRPDLLAAVGVTAGELAESLYDSLHDKLLDLPDAVKVFPAHGAGSACGKNLSTETSSTIGDQRRTNYALAPMTRDEFVAIITEGQPSAPAYFGYDAKRNRQERPLLDEAAETPALTLVGALAQRDAGTFLLDVRDSADFAGGHLAGSVNVGLDGRFAEYAGSVVPVGTPIVLISPDELADEARVRLARIGFDDVVGYLPVTALTDPAAEPEIRHASRLTALELAERQRDVDGLVLVDIRNPGEVVDGMLDDAVHIPLAQLPARLDELDPTAPTVVYCAGGYRSAVAASLLEQAGFADVSDVLGGYGACTTLVPTHA